MDVLTVSHVIISLIGIASGFIVMGGLLRGKVSAWTGTFLATTALTSATGFLFSFHGLKPPHILGIISLVVLAIAPRTVLVGPRILSKVRTMTLAVPYQQT